MTAPSYCGSKLWDLLPPLYRIADESGDLAAFLAVPAPTLDEIKDLADRFPEIFDVDGCTPRYLPLLSAIVGHRWNPLRDEFLERRDIREAVERYRRKGTIPAIRRSLVAVGWQGEIEETFRKVLRLGQRARLGRQRLAGQIYSFGVWRIRSDSRLGLGPAVRAELPFHHPAGTRVFYFETEISVLDRSADVVPSNLLDDRQSSVLDSRRIFVANRSRLGSRDRLTRWGRTAEQLAAISTSVTSHRPVRAGACLRRWHARRPGLRLNFGAVGDRLVNLWISELRRVLCCAIDVEEPPVGRHPVMRPNRQRLNRSLLNRAVRECCTGVRQKDFLETTLALRSWGANLFTVIEWPAPPTVQLDSGLSGAVSEAGNLFTVTRWPAAA